MDYKKGQGIRLLRKGLVSKVESKSDRRLAMRQLTDKGNEIAERNKKFRSEKFQEMFSKMSPDQQDAFLKGVEGFLSTALGSAEEIRKFCAHCGIDHRAFCIVNKAHEKTTGAQIENY